MHGNSGAGRHRAGPDGAFCIGEVRRVFAAGVRGRAGHMGPVAADAEKKEGRCKMKNEYTVTWELYRTWLLENMAKRKRLTLSAVWCALAVWCVLALWKTLPAFALVLAALCVYRAVGRDFVVAKKQYELQAKVCGGENWRRTIVLENDGIVISEGNICVRYGRADIVRIREKGDRIWLDMRDDMVVRMYRSAFSEGSWEECRAMLE